MKTTVLIHNSEAGETYSVKVFRGNDPAKLKAAVQEFVEAEQMRLRGQTLDDDEEPDDVLDEEDLGLERNGRWEPMNPEEVWEKFDPSSDHILHWDFKPSDTYRIRVFADAHDIVEETEGV